MIGPAIGIFAHAPAKLTERHQQNALEISLLFQIRDKCGHGIVQRAHQSLVGIDLTCVSVEPAQAGVINARRQTAADHARNQIKAGPELRGRIGHVRFILSRDGQDLVRADLGIERRATQKIFRARVRLRFSRKRGDRICLRPKHFPRPRRLIPDKKLPQR